MAVQTNLLACRIGVVLTRLVVPAWVALGAIIKLLEGNPHLLPARTVLAAVGAIGLDEHLVLAVLVGLELLAATIMLTLGPLARPTALVVLGAYCALLFGELVQGNMVASGCLGTLSPSTLTMMAINVSLLLAVVFFDPTNIVCRSPGNLPRAAAILLAVGAILLTWQVMGQAATERRSDEATKGFGTGAGSTQSQERT